MIYIGTVCYKGFVMVTSRIKDTLLIYIPWLTLQFKGILYVHLSVLAILWCSVGFPLICSTFENSFFLYKV